MLGMESYNHLRIEERAVLEVMRYEGYGVRAISRRLGRAPSTVSRELRRNEEGLFGPKPYVAKQASHRAHALSVKARCRRKLSYDGALFSSVVDLLRMKWSPYQIALRIKEMRPSEPRFHVSHETIYTALYAMPRGHLRKELIACLRRAHSVRKPQRRGIKPVSEACQSMLSIHVRPPEIEDRIVPGHWEGDLLVGKGHRSCIGTLVERTTRLLLLVKMKDATALSALEGFSKKLNAIPNVMRKTLTYDRGSEMRKHKELAERTGMTIYFADPHSPWQKGGVENMNGLLRQYFPKGTDLSVYSQEDLDKVAFEMNTRPRVVLNAKMPLEKFAELYEPHLNQSVANSNQSMTNLHNMTTVALDL